MTTKVMITMPRGFLRQIDEVARKERRTRSEFIREAARFYMEQKTPSRPIDDPVVQEAYNRIVSTADRWSGKWNSAEAVRRMRDKRYSK